MSVELETANAIKSLIESIEAVTGESHYDLTSAVQALKNGYGQGGDSKFKDLLAGTLTEITAEDLKDIVTIGSYQFNDQSNLARVVIPDNITQIGSYAFQNCTAMEYLKTPVHVIYKVNCFSNARILDKLDFSVGSGQFPDLTSTTYKFTPWRNDYGLEHPIIIPSGVTRIGDYTFNLQPLTSIYLPKTITSIGTNALYVGSGNYDPVNIYYEGTEEEWNVIEIGENNNGLTNAIFHYNSTGLPEE